MDIKALLSEAANLAQTAVQFDKSSCYDAAAYYYREAATKIKSAVSQLEESGVALWKTKAEEYCHRADLITSPSFREEGSTKGQRRDESDLSKCKYLLEEALNADEAGDTDVALELYTNAVKLCLLVRSEITDEVISQKLRFIAVEALQRAETLKGVEPQQPIPSTSSPPVMPHTSQAVPVGHAERKLHRGSSAHLIITGSDRLSDAEKRVLLATSKINGIEYVPFMEIDLREKFQGLTCFDDKNGKLALSPKQKERFGGWARPSELIPNPIMVRPEGADCYSIKQTIISDCSFVASLAVSALYERQFKKTLITSIIYPQNKNKQPVYNPFGKYMIKLHLNGVPRKIIIDDTLPVGRHNELLCSFSTNKNELWISLLEKAYMKVMGGYDFPGSNSNIDLHALTGWIPERQSIRPGEADFNAEQIFAKFHDRFKLGHVLLTVATGELPESKAEVAGLVTTHAYAVLDIRCVNGVKLLKLKNPWSHVRWKGNYSELDVVNWTKSLQNELNYDPKSAEMFDNGVFWIDYKSILEFFDVFYMNWNPEMFAFTSVIHDWWNAGKGPARDNYNVGENPQFRLSVDPKIKNGAVWLLLSRHITDINDFRDNSEYITLLVYTNEGRRVYYPMDPPPFIDGVRINSPHYLAKVKISDTSPSKFTLVMSQYLKTSSIYYTLRAYATCKFTLEKIVDPYVHVLEEKGAWTKDTAGGCQNHPGSYGINPKYKITTEEHCQILVILKGPRVYQIGMELIPEQIRPDFSPVSTGAYRSGFAVLEATLEPGSYFLTPATFTPSQESAFFLTFKSSHRINITRIR